MQGFFFISWEWKDNMGKQRLKFDLLVHDLKVPLAVIEAGATSLLQRMEK